MQFQKIGEVLLEKHIIPQEVISSLLQNMDDENTGSRFPLLNHPEQLHYLNEKQIKHLIGALCQIEVVNHDDIEWDSEVINLIPASLTQKHQMIPVALLDNETVMLVACKKPLSEQVVDHLRKTTLKEIRQMLLTADDFSALHQKIYPNCQPINLIRSNVNKGEDHAVDTVDQIILQAIQNRASDIHIEPAHDHTRVRIRIDGLLHTIGELSPTITRPVTSRIKILANMDIANRLVPQEGSFVFSHIDLETPPTNIRVSVLPSILGEKAVLRLLPPEESLLPLNHLGMPNSVHNMFIETLKSPNGVILVTGPAASGKSTTLYSVLQQLRDERTNICTIEDQIEMMMTGINQFQVNPQNKLSFSQILHSLLRQDPNIIMVGEIRDRDTAETALQAGLTGHLVFATLHTNDASSAFTRLIEMGCEPYLVASAIRAVLSQRLVRKVCESCRAERSPRDEELRFYGIQRENIPTVSYGKGCEMCHGTGFNDRTGLFEFLPVYDALQNLILENAAPLEMQKWMKENNLLLLRDDGLKKLSQGTTTIDEVAHSIFIKK